ncbi:uncharacterized protein LOC143236776 [Tachypleus tridentatus]|uniref:uncharacterized protein LOC143236776 n=1 Tax=Tachypleus tridentatus TaxID=6853 RepID=UPI003FD12355
MWADVVLKINYNSSGFTQSRESRQALHADFKWTTEEGTTADHPTLEVQTWLASVFVYFTCVGARTNGSWTVKIVTLTTHVKLYIVFPQNSKQVINIRQKTKKKKKKKSKVSIFYNLLCVEWGCGIGWRYALSSSHNKGLFRIISVFSKLKERRRGPGDGVGRPTPRVRITSKGLTGGRLSSAADSAGNPAWLAVELMVGHTGGFWVQGGEPGILRSVKGVDSLRKERPTGSSNDVEYGDHTNLMTRGNNLKSLSIALELDICGDHGNFRGFVVRSSVVWSFSKKNLKFGGTEIRSNGTGCNELLGILVFSSPEKDCITTNTKNIKKISLLLTNFSSV